VIDADGDYAARAADRDLGVTSAIGCGFAEWPQPPEPLDPGEGSRADRHRMLRFMRAFWLEVNESRRERLSVELETERSRQRQVDEYWNRHKDAVVARWQNRTGGRGKTTVSDIPEVAAQYSPDNALPPEQVGASDGDRGFVWLCPLDLGHEPWKAAPKDRVQKGSGCPACRSLLTLADLRVLAEQYAGITPATELTFASHQSVRWLCRTWAVEPFTGQWEQVEHEFPAVIKSRALQGDGCLVCAGYQVDRTNSLLTWFPELAEELDDPDLDPATLPTSSHNASRRGDPGSEDGSRSDRYASITWRCRHGHRWPATILNRVQGEGCPDCSTSGISKEQVRVAAELAGLLELIPPGLPDPRLPEGIPDFSSHKLDIPSGLKPAGWRYKQVEVDAIFRHPQALIAVEYDGSYHHSTARRNRAEFECAKDELLELLGYLPIRLRMGDLPPLDSPAVMLQLPERATPFETAAAVVQALEDRYAGEVDGVAAYVADGKARNQKLADGYIQAVWGDLRPRRKPVRPAGATRKQRALRATDPHPASLLTPAGDPYRNPEPGGPTLRDYDCACGGQLKAAAQSQVTSGNTRSCGCLAREAKKQSKTPIDPIESAAARRWAQDRGIPVGENGRLPARVVASFRLAKAGISDHLGDGGQLDESAVRDWAEHHEVRMLARGRISEQAWLDYASSALGERLGR